MFQVAGDEIVCLSGLRAFQKHIVVWVGTRCDGVWGPYPNGFAADGIKRSCNSLFSAPKPGASDNFLVFGINVAAHTQLDQPAKCEYQSLGWRSKGLQQSRYEDIGVNDYPDHEPGCCRDSRWALRAASISASISSVDSWLRPDCAASPMMFGAIPERGPVATPDAHSLPLKGRGHEPLP